MASDPGERYEEVMRRAAEASRQEYNRAFQEPVQRWSLDDPAACRRAVAALLSQARRSGAGALQGGRALDVGCAKGVLTEALRLAGFEAWGLDYSEVAIEQSRQRFPGCRFVHMDGLHPSFEVAFDLIVCRGFSAADTHDLDYVATWVRRYLKLLRPGGLFAFAYSTDWSGKKPEGGEASWSRAEIERFGAMLPAQLRSLFVHPRRTLGRRLKDLVRRAAGRRIDARDYFYLLYQVP